MSELRDNRYHISTGENWGGCDILTRGSAKKASFKLSSFTIPYWRYLDHGFLGCPGTPSRTWFCLVGLIRLVEKKFMVGAPNMTGTRNFLTFVNATAIA